MLCPVHIRIKSASCAKENRYEGVARSGLALGLGQLKHGHRSGFEKPYRIQVHAPAISRCHSAKELFTKAVSR